MDYCFFDKKDDKHYTPEEETRNIIDWIKAYFVENGPNSKAVIGISGGKDSNIAAALCVKALGAENVIGVLMPAGEQYDIEDARKVCKFLGIKSYEINIGTACTELYQSINNGISFDNKDITEYRSVTTNLPARIRMTTLYSIAAYIGGRVCNTCNKSELYVGYSTKYGDRAGDFAPLAAYTVTELLQIGDVLRLPKDLVYKAPGDGMCGMTDENNLGFTYKELDNFILSGIAPESYETFKKIKQANRRNRHKIQDIRIPFCPSLNKHERNFWF